MKRREFILRSGLATGTVIAGLPAFDCQGASAIAKPGALKLRWSRDPQGGLFTGVSCDGEPLAATGSPCLLDGFCRVVADEPAPAMRLTALHPLVASGPLRAELSHRLHDSGNGQGEDLLEGTLVIENRSREPQQILVGFVTSVRPSANASLQRLHLPLAATCNHPAMGDCRNASHKLAEFAAGARPFTAHYLEPLASDPPTRSPAAPLLVPVLDIHQAGLPQRIALITRSGQPRFFASLAAESGASSGWRAQTAITLAPGQKFEDHCFLLVHGDDVQVAWRAFHRFAHHDAHAVPSWLNEVRVHYYDFLSAEDPAGRRGDGYEAGIPYFREFRVGLATQHGYYACMGDHILPGRKSWMAMQSDKHGPVEMSFDKIKARLKATRDTGARAAIYMHLTALDDSSNQFYPGLAAARLVGRDGQPQKYSWNGPDVKGGLWQMSLAAPEWRAHLLQQARWIMEIFQPDAIVFDETFTGIGYDEHPDRKGPLSPHAIQLIQQLRSVVRSFGTDCALLLSDCSMAGFSLWADGECGDHAYATLLGDPEYRRPPLRYRSVLNDKPWIPCAWHFQQFWQAQMDLARSGARTGVGVSNGWGEFTGLHRLPPAVRTKMVTDIATLFPGSGR